MYHLAILVSLLLAWMASGQSFAELGREMQVFVASRFAAAAYCNPGRLAQWRCGERCEIVTRLEDRRVMRDGGLLAFLGRSDELRLIVVSFRGTVHLENYLTDVSVGQEECPWNGAFRIHTGFLDAYRRIAPAVVRWLRRLVEKYPGYFVLFTGHSLGGALSILSVSHTGLGASISFGCPRVGNAEFASQFAGTGSVFRAINENDVVPHVPWGASYTHPPQELWRHGEQLTQCSAVDGEDKSCSNSLRWYGYFAHLHFNGLYFAPVC